MDECDKCSIEICYKNRIKIHKCKPPHIFYEGQWQCGKGRVYCIHCHYIFNNPTKYALEQDFF